MCWLRTCETTKGQISPLISWRSDWLWAGRLNGSCAIAPLRSIGVSPASRLLCAEPVQALSSLVALHYARAPFIGDPHDREKRNARSTSGLHGSARRRTHHRQTGLFLCSRDLGRDGRGFSHSYAVTHHSARRPRQGA